MRRNYSVVVAVSALFLSMQVVLGGCSQSRAQKLAARASDVEDSLLEERDRVLTMSQGVERSARLDHLSSLNLQLRAANISRAAAPMLLEGQQVDMAYDVLDEVYGTIDWNIPLARDDVQAKALPSLFERTGLDFDRFKAMPVAPAGGVESTTDRSGR